MPARYNINDFFLGNPSYSGHETYPDAIYTSPDKETPPVKKLIKMNKHGDFSFSRMEVAFSRIARLFLAPDLTPELHLVENDFNSTVGVTVQHLCYVIEKKEGLHHSFYTFKDPKIDCKLTEFSTNDPTKIPYYFLEKLPQGFFARLIKEIDLDYYSLASLMASCLTLEEDDLHRGNFGFYIVKKNGKPQVVFFKIDHDLMFVDSIMSFYTRRPFHLFHGPHAFDLHAEDLLSFINLKHSLNSYWPTKFGYIANPFGKKEYHSYADIAAFSNLADNPKFINAKWRAFYKHILISRELIEQSLKECLDENDTCDRADIALIAQATISRVARLKAVLFSIKEFRDYVSGLSEEENNALFAEVNSQNTGNKKISTQRNNSLVSYQDMCQAGREIDEGDTPLHLAIKFGEYRYEETLQNFAQFINTKNKAGKTPLDIALMRVGLANLDVSQNPRFIMKHLLEHGAKETQDLKQFNKTEQVEALLMQNPYLEKLPAAKTYTQFKNILHNIGEDHRYCLKFKKNFAIECLEQWIKQNKKDPECARVLPKLQDEINGDASEELSAGLKYIRQLRSSLWIIRQLRGLYGKTSTLNKMNELIDQAIEEIKPKRSNCFSFFSCSSEDSDTEYEMDNLVSVNQS